MNLLITGGYGFLGSNLAARAIEDGIDILIIDNMSRAGAWANKEWLTKKKKHLSLDIDIRDESAIRKVIKRYKPNAVFHLAGQVAMTTSIQYPRLDFDVNVGGTLNILEAIRNTNPYSIVVYSSTNKVYGDLSQYTYIEEASRWRCLEYPNGFDENIPLNFQSPYGCSKGSADQYMLDYARIYGLNCVVFRHSSMYGGRQFSTSDQGWIGWFCCEALRVKKGQSKFFTISGDGKQVRDVLHSSDMVDLYFKVLKSKGLVAGKAFNVGGGIQNSLSLIELFCELERLINAPIPIKYEKSRKSDQLVFVADSEKIRSLIEWEPKVSKGSGIDQMLLWAGESVGLY